MLVVDAAEQRDRPFHQAGDFVEQARIIHDGQGFLGGECRDAVGDDALAVVRVGTSTRCARKLLSASRRRR